MQSLRVELTWAKVSKEEILKRKGKKRSKKPKKKDRSEMTEDDLKRSIRKSRSTIRRSIMGSKADHLLTLTYRENAIVASMHDSATKFNQLLVTHL